LAEEVGARGYLRRLPFPGIEDVYLFETERMDGVENLAQGFFKEIMILF